MTRCARNLLLASLLVATACSTPPRVPEGILPPRQMKEVLREVFTADDWVQHRRDSDTAYNRPDSSIMLYRGILQRHKISEADFKKSFRYYEEHPELLKDVLDSMQVPPAPTPDGDAPTKKLAS
ncbi:MAG: DUF4296 domain-containing protein [Chitinophagaceae bacterium]|nr:MAG: DUF4296 domain-containing protein [Chitinophagaceae bacterium]